MHCPYCHQELTVDVTECPSCRLNFPRTSALLGVTPRLTPVVADTCRKLRSADFARLKKRIGRMQERFPQLVMQIVLHECAADHPFSLYGFWLFNAAAFAGNSRRGKDNHAVMILLDPKRRESAIVPGYGLEPFLSADALGHLLELAQPSWEEGRWSDGLMTVLDGMDQLLTAISQESDLQTVSGDF